MFIIIICLGILVYSNTFLAPFQLDDTSSIVANFFIRNIHHLYHIWNFWPCRFITYLSIALNYHFNGLNVIGYHVFNLAVHLITAILVWWLALLTLSTPVMKEDKIGRHANIVALFAGLIFVSHPLQTEAVTYIVQRAASMATMFYLLSLNLFIKSRLLQINKSSSGSWRLCYLGALVSAIMAMFTKEMTVTLPLMMMLYEFSFLSTKKNFNGRYLFPFLLTLFIIPLTFFFTESLKAQQMRGVIAEGATHISHTDYLVTQLRVMTTYIRLAFLPLNQNLDYDYLVFHSIFEWPVLGSSLLLIAILYFAKRMFSKYRLIAFSIFWFFLTLLPESSFLTIKDLIFEHRLYLPLVGYSLFLSSSMYYLFRPHGPHTGHSQKLAGQPSLFGKDSLKMMVVVLVVIISCNSILTYQRNKVWNDEISMWEDVIRKSPYKERPYDSRGFAYYKRGKITEAFADFDKAIEINPRYPGSYDFRGIVYYSQGSFIQAMADFNKALEIMPDFAEVYFNRGLVYYSQGDFVQALSDFNKAIELKFNNPDVYNNRGIIYARQGDFIQALSNFDKAIELDPDDAQAYCNRGNTYYSQGQLAQALLDYNKALKIDPKDTEAYNNRILVYRALK